MNKSTATLLSTATALVFTGCQTAVHGPLESTAVKLDIPDCRWDPGRYDRTVGWCGEACIQMAMAHFGRTVSQQAINEAGNPRHPDLYSSDIDTALDRLGVTYLRWDESIRDQSAFEHWIKTQLIAGYPVICGIKIYPDKHPDWSLDHFVLAVGFNEHGLILNTQLDLDGQILVSYAQLSSRNNGYSFRSRRKHFFARAITGLQPEADSRAKR